MRPIHLIRHASPQIQPNVPNTDWTLSDRGIEEARALAKIASTWDLEAIYTSAEAKARATALLLAEDSGLQVAVVDGLEELRIDAWVGNSDAFSELVRSVLEGRDVPARGVESASAAAARFAEAMSIVAEGPLPAAVVSHGRILTAYLAELLKLEAPFDFWRAIPIPAHALLDLDGPALIHPFVGVATP